MKEIQDIFDLVSKAGYYTKSFEEFQKQMSDPAYRAKAERILKEDNMWSDEMAPIFSGAPVDNGSLKKKSLLRNIHRQMGYWRLKDLIESLFLGVKGQLAISQNLPR